MYYMGNTVLKKDYVKLIKKYFLKCTSWYKSLLSLRSVLGGESFQCATTVRKVLLLKNL